jgi:dihydroxyacetone kinase phosphotransfer subunit
MIGIVIVSHSARLAEGVKELADQMTQGSVQVAAAGGAPDGSLGTSVDGIRAAIERVYSPDGVLVLMDLGSAVMSAQIARESLDRDPADRVLLCDAPLVEGAVVAAVEASTGKSLREVEAAAMAARQLQKVER